MKRNKIRYQSTPKTPVIIVASGNVYLLYVDDDAIAAAQKGDMMVYPFNDALNSTALGAYDRTGFSGYFKVDICDGKKWCPVLVQEIFPDNMHYFSKKERPEDTYALCREILTGWAGKPFARTYREHYAPGSDEA